MRVFPLAPLGVGALFFRDPTPRLALVVKSALRIAAEPSPTLSSAGVVAPVSREISDPGGSGALLRANDFVPRKARGEILIVGSARAATATLSIPVAVGLGLGARKQALALSTSPTTVIRLAPGSVRSEIGEPSGLGPIASLPMTPSAARDEREAWWSERWLEVASAESGERFQAAPMDQQTFEELGPGSPLTLQNLVAPGGSLAVALPAAWPWLWLVERGLNLESARRLRLRLDTVFVDTDRASVELGFRAELELGSLSGYPDIVVGLGRGFEPPSVPEVEALLASTQPVAASEAWTSAVVVTASSGTLAPPAPNDEDDDSPPTLSELVTVPGAISPAARGASLVRGGTLPPGPLGVEPTLDDDTSDRPTQHPPARAAQQGDDEDDDDRPTPPPRRAMETEAPPPSLEATQDEIEDGDGPRSGTALHVMSPARAALPFARGGAGLSEADDVVGTGTVMGAQSPAAGALPFGSKRETQIPPPSPASTSGQALPFAHRSDTIPPAPMEDPVGTGTVLGGKSPVAGALPFARGGASPPASRPGTPFVPGPPASSDEIRSIAAALGPLSRPRAETLPMDRRPSGGAALPFARSQNPPAPPPAAPVRPSSTIPPPPVSSAAAPPPWAPPPPPSVPFRFSAPATEPPPAHAVARPIALVVEPPRKPKLGARELARALCSRPEDRASSLAASGTEALGFARARAAWSRVIDGEVREGKTTALDELLSALHGAAVGAPPP
ncbi:MAG: DUF2169 domain-containing protein [Polyangiaceae bacterium]|nr:DUF2169 domain-containing protein [Polyangiaceae bacterium]